MGKGIDAKRFIDHFRGRTFVEPVRPTGTVPKRAAMTDFILKHCADDVVPTCTACGEQAGKAGAVVLSQTDGTVLCRSCGRSQAPELAALLDLSDVADRVGRVSRGRGLWLPLDDLLEMTRVAQEFHLTRNRFNSTS